MDKGVRNMETRQRAGGTGKRHNGARRRDRRRLLQLLSSLLLFLLVFIGRGVFPAWSRSLGDLLCADADLSAVFDRLADKATVLDDLRAMLGSTEGETKPTDGQGTGSDPAELPRVELLSDSPAHGLSALREQGMTAPAVKKTAPEPEPAPAVVTAVAQAYNADGVALPSNVSYEYYDLGLEKTVVPVNGTVTSGFEYRKSPISGKNEFHLALDIAAAEGAEIHAFADGTVRYIGESDEFGLYLMIDHANHAATFYAHCSKLLVRKGDKVSCGDTVALVGHTGNATGSHLHFTVLKDNIRLDPAYYVSPS